MNSRFGRAGIWLLSQLPQSVLRVHGKFLSIQQYPEFSYCRFQAPILTSGSVKDIFYLLLQPLPITLLQADAVDEPDDSHTLQSLPDNDHRQVRQLRRVASVDNGGYSPYSKPPASTYLPEEFLRFSKGRLDRYLRGSRVAPCCEGWLGDYLADGVGELLA